MRTGARHTAHGAGHTANDTRRMAEGALVPLLGGLATLRRGLGVGLRWVKLQRLKGVKMQRRKDAMP